MVPKLIQRKGFQCLGISIQTRGQAESGHLDFINDNKFKKGQKERLAHLNLCNTFLNAMPVKI